MALDLTPNVGILHRVIETDRKVWTTHKYMSKPTEFTAFEFEVRRHIEQCGVPYKELAERTGVHVNQIGRFMRGERGLTSWSLGRIFAFLGMKVSEPNKRWTIPANLAGRPKATVARNRADGLLEVDHILPESVRAEKPFPEPRQAEYLVPERKSSENAEFITLVMALEALASDLAIPDHAHGARSNVIHMITQMIGLVGKLKHQAIGKRLRPYISVLVMVNPDLGDEEEVSNRLKEAYRHRNNLLHGEFTDEGAVRESLEFLRVFVPKLLEHIEINDVKK